MLKTVGFPSTRTGDQTIVGGDLVIGTAGQGVDFSSNSNAPGMTSELFDWYEEGAWTPVAVPAAGAITTQVSSGTYTRVGNVVTASFYLSIVDAGTATNLDLVSGLPYAAQNTENMGSGCIREFNTTGKTWNFTLLQNATQMFCRVYDNTSTIASGYAWRGSVTYHV